MNQLVILEQLNPLEIFTPEGTEDILAKLTKEARSHVLDISTEEGRDHIRSLAYKIARSKTHLDDMGKELVSDAKEKIKLVDAERKRIRDALDELKDEIRAPLTEWETDPRPSIEWLFFEAPVSDRKLRLLGVSCCRPIVLHLGEFKQLADNVLTSAEALADGQIRSEILGRHFQELYRRHHEYLEECFQARLESRADPEVASVSGHDITLGAMAVLNTARHVEGRDAPGAGDRRWERFQEQDTETFGPILMMQAGLFVRSLSGKNYLIAKSEEADRQRHLLRDIFGNPFRPVTFLPEWRTSTVLALAQQMYESRDFSAMPILADALTDAGCEQEAILTHCRGPGPHVRGCHVVDATLNKA